jgi:dTDP-4-dehydrorhamnose reductase
MRLNDKLPGRVLMLGGGGLLGTAMIPALEGAGVEVLAPPSGELDVRDLGALRARVAGTRPDLIFNTAAEASVDRAEKDPDHAFQVNGLGAHNAALAAAEAEVPLVHISTDYVFSGVGRRAPYQEHDPTGVPPNHYGRSKLQGELLVRATWPRHFIVRVAALFGPGRRDFVDWVLADASPDKPLTIVADRFVTPTWTEDLARQLLALIETPYFGTYHATGHGPASWFELARSALELSGRDPAGVVAVPDTELPTPPRRAAYTCLDNHLLRMRGLDRMLPWRDALRRHLSGARLEP